MALFPLTSNFEEDFVLQLLAVDTDHTMDQVAAAAAHHSVGRRVADRPIADPRNLRRSTAFRRARRSRAGTTRARSTCSVGTERR